MFGMKQIYIPRTPTIKARRLNSQLEFIQDDYISPEIREKYKNVHPQYLTYLTEVLENEGCQLSGYYDVYKAPGELSFFIYIYEQDLAKFGINTREIMDKLTLTHKLKSLTFGNITDQQTMINLFGESSITDFNKADEMPIQKDVNYCLYYLAAMPHMFSIGKEKFNKETYQYSYVYTCETTPMQIAAYQLTLAFFANPVGISYTREDWSFFTFLTSTSAIIAGIYVIMGVIKRALEKFF